MSSPKDAYDPGRVKVEPLREGGRNGGRDRREGGRNGGRDRRKGGRKKRQIF